MVHQVFRSSSRYKNKSQSLKFFPIRPRPFLSSSASFFVYAAARCFVSKIYIRWCLESFEKFWKLEPEKRNEVSHAALYTGMFSIKNFFDFAYSCNFRTENAVFHRVPTLAECNIIRFFSSSWADNSSTWYLLYTVDTSSGKVVLLWQQSVKR